MVGSSCEWAPAGTLLALMSPKECSGHSETFHIVIDSVAHIDWNLRHCLCLCEIHIWYSFPFPFIVFVHVIFLVLESCSMYWIWIMFWICWVLTVEMIRLLNQVVQELHSQYVTNCLHGALFLKYCIQRFICVGREGKNSSCVMCGVPLWWHGTLGMFISGTFHYGGSDFGILYFSTKSLIIRKDCVAASVLVKYGQNMSVFCYSSHMMLYFAQTYFLDWLGLLIREGASITLNTEPKNDLDKHT